MIYLDNAATSYPKPRGMAEYMAEITSHRGGSYGRGGYSTVIKNAEDVLSVRMKVCDLLGSDSPEQIVFTKNATEALNIAILGSVSRGETVIVSPLEHNSVMRPINTLGCNIITLPLNEDGSTDVTALVGCKLPSLVVINHASNVSGVINDVDFVTDFCKRHRVPCLIDASQTAGHIPLKASWGAMIAFSGHKGLLGPQGTGVLYIPKDTYLRPLITGGTGNSSELVTQPEDLPDKFESGTLNTPAILGLGYSLNFLNKRGHGGIHTHEMDMTRLIINELSNIKDINVLYPKNTNRTPCVSFYSNKIDCVDLGNIIDRDYNIAIRCGLHCAPAAHRAYNTISCGTARVSPGPFTKFSDVEKFLYAVNKTIKNCRT